jgi:hypothetical protein
MAFANEVLDEILKDCHGPEDFYGPQGIMKQPAKALTFDDKIPSMCAPWD